MAGEGGRISILGDGQMGLVLAVQLSSQPEDLDVRLWGHDAGEVGRLAQERRSDRLPGLELPSEVRVTPNPETALAGADVVVSAVPTQYVRSVWGRVCGYVPAEAGVVSVAKGLENGTLLRPSQIVTDVLNDTPDSRARQVGVLSGPTIAAELARCLPATMIAASEDRAFAERIQTMFSTSYLRIYTSEDPLGVEVAGALKNVIAIAAGILDGLQAGFNAKSALLARGLAEISRLGTAMGARAETFFGLAGVGDLATTCFSPEGRNRSLGEALGKGRTLEEYLEGSTSIVEGVATVRSVVELAREHKVEMPIATAVHAVLYEGMDPIDGIARLMSREPKAERVG